MRRNRGRRSRVEKQEEIQQPEVIPPEMESDPEPEEESDQDAEEDQREAELQADDAEPQDENVVALGALGEYFPAVAMVQVDTPCIVPIAFGNHEFKIAMSRVEFEPDNYIWAVKLVHDEEDEAACHCKHHEGERHCCHSPLQENPV